VGQFRQVALNIPFGHLLALLTGNVICTNVVRKPSRQIGDRLMRLLTTFILLTICLTAIGQTSLTRKWIDTEVMFTDSVGQSVMVYNSLPKGGGRYIDSDGKVYSYVIFWTRVINESATPVELAIKFSTDSLVIFPSPDSYIKILLPPDTMTLDKVPLGDYGLTNLKSFLDAGFNKPSMLQRTINPKEECLFYISVVFYQARGTTRAALVLKGQDHYFKITVDPDLDSALIPSALIPCGQLVFKN
jgi:hypothetical protein